MNFSGQLIEAKDYSGQEWEVAILQAGRSGNQVYYPPDVLRKAVPLFEGVRALARAEEEHLRDVNRSARDIVGWFSDPCFESVNEAGVARITARFHISESANWLKRLMLDAWKQGKKDIVGFSIVAEGKARRKKMGRELLTYVDSIEKVFTVDIVLNPAAGGRFLKLVAGCDKSQQEEACRMDKLLKLLELKAPDLYKRIDPETVTEDEILELIGKALSSDANGLLAEARKTIKWAESRALLREKLIESRLPALVADRLEKRFADRIFQATELEAAIAEEREYLARLSESGRVSGCGGRVHVGDSEADKTVTALDGFFANHDLNKVPRFRSFREAYVTITGDVNLTGQLKEAKNLHRFAEALNSASWAEILGDSVTRRMLVEYNLPALQEWRKIASDITAPKDFRTNRRLRIGGYGELPAVAEAGTYLNLTSPGDEEATYSIAKKGGLEELTLEMIANDDVGAIRRIPGRLARAAANTLYRTVFDVVKDNAVIYDSLALFHATHNNLGSSALDATSLLAAKKSMGKQTAYGATTEVLGLVPQHILVPLDLEDTAFRLTNSNSVIGVANNAGTEPNFHSTYGLEVIVVPYWTDANNWALVCNPADCPTIEVGFFNGQEEPELFVQDQPNVGSMFTADKITYKIRHIYGVCVLDYRGMYKSVVI